MHIVPRKIEKKAKRKQYLQNNEKHKVRGKVSKEFCQIKKSEDIFERYILVTLNYSFICIYLCLPCTSHSFKQ